MRRRDHDSKKHRQGARLGAGTHTATLQAARGKIKQPGEWFITDAMDKIDQWAMTLTELGREYGVLHGYEELVG
jgi:hypothetical protein